MLYHFIVPVDEHVVKKNGRSIFVNKKTGRMFPGKSSKLITAEKHLINEFKKQANRKPIEFPINLMMLFYFRRDIFYTKRGTQSKRLPDLSNLYQLPEDCLQQAGIITNDTIVSGHDGSRRMPISFRQTGIDLDLNYLEIIITEM